MGQEKNLSTVYTTLATEHASPIFTKPEIIVSSPNNNNKRYAYKVPIDDSISDTSSSSSSTQTDNESRSSFSSSPLSVSSTGSRSLVRQISKSKILLFHPSIVSPSNARKLEDVRYITVLYNPTSGSRRGAKVMAQAVAKFEASGLEVTTIQLQHKGHATQICATRPDFEDIDVLCVVGGDGTFHEVVNGLMQNPLWGTCPGALPALSVIPAGTDNSMVRELQGISSVRLSTDQVLLGTTVAIDVLKVTILAPRTTPPVPSDEGQYLANIDGNKFVKKEVVYAFNSVHWGLASRVLEKAERMRWMGHGIRYTAAALMEMMQGKSTHARVVLEDERGVVTTYGNDTFCLLIANNIGTAGKGMKIAPKAKINDGLIDVLLIRSHKPWHLMKIFERMYSGTHIDLPYVEYKQVRKFSIIPFKPAGELEVQGNPQIATELVDIDGELKGCTPFEVEVMPRALELVV